PWSSATLGWPDTTRPASTGTTAALAAGWSVIVHTAAGTCPTTGWTSRRGMATRGASGVREGTVGGWPLGAAAAVLGPGAGVAGTGCTPSLSGTDTGMPFTE